MKIERNVLGKPKKETTADAYKTKPGNVKEYTLHQKSDVTSKGASRHTTQPDTKTQALQVEQARQNIKSRNLRDTKNSKVAEMGRNRMPVPARKTKELVAN